MRGLGVYAALFLHLATGVILVFTLCLMVDCCRIPKKIVWHCLCELSWGLSILVYVLDDTVSASPYFIVVYIVRALPIVLKLWDVCITFLLLASPNNYFTDTHPLFLVITYIVSDLVHFYIFPSLLLVNITLIFPLKTLYMCALNILFDTTFIYSNIL